MITLPRTLAVCIALSVPGAMADPLDLKNCQGQLLSDTAFDEPIIRDHTDPSYGALANAGVRPLGGGEGYQNIVAKPKVGVVQTAAELRAAIAASQEGPRIIYVDDNADIDLSYCAKSPLPAECFEPRSRPLSCDSFTLTLPAGTTLASGRGRDGSRGARLFSRTFTGCPLIAVGGDKVRISGVRLHGPDPSKENDDPTHCDGEAVGIDVQTVDAPKRWDTEIDNSELSAWPSSAIRVANVTGVNIHHNVLQYNRRQEHNNTCGSHSYGLGYGVVMSSGGAVIKANVFDHNRHDIASGGEAGSFYRAIYNLVLTGAVQHSYDVHGGKDRKDCTNVAGSGFVVHHNTFIQNRKPAVRIRGIPMRGMWIYKNEYGKRTGYAPYSQINSSGRFHVSDNRENVGKLPAWFISFGGKSLWQWRRFDKLGMSDAGIGDFDGDGVKDVLRRTSSGWQFARSGREDWTPLNGLKDQVSKLKFGDFVGANTTDVVRDNGNEWQVSREGSGPWEFLMSTSKALGDAAFGDFTGDGKDDVFFADGTGWTIVESFLPLTRRHYAEPFKLKDLRFGYFTGDDKLDVVRTSEHGLMVWDRVTKAWFHLNSDLYGLQNLTFADFNGDGTTDIATNNNGNWIIQWSGRTGWEFLNTSDVNLKSQKIADFNGDGKADVLSRQSPDTADE